MDDMYDRIDTIEDLDKELEQDFQNELTRLRTRLRPISRNVNDEIRRRKAMARKLAAQLKNPKDR